MTTPAIALFGVIVFLALIIRYEKGIALLILLIPFIDLLPETGIPGINGITILIVTAFATALINRTSKLQYTGQTTLSLPIILLFFLSLASAIYTHKFRSVPEYDLGLVIFFLKRWYTFILLYYIYRSGVTSRKLIETCIYMIVVGVLLEGLYVLKEDLLTTHGRTYGTLGNENDLGAFFAAYFPIGVFFFLDAKNMVRKWTGGGMAMLAFMGVTLSLSRGAFLSLMAAILVFFFYRSKALFVVILILSLLVVVNYRFVLPEKVVERIDYTFSKADDLEFSDEAGLEDDGLQLESSAAKRLILWQGALKMLRDSPIFGVGFATFHLLSLQYLADMGLRKKLVAHNMYMQVAAELGLTGFIVFLMLLFFAFRSGIMLRNHGKDSFARGLGVAFLACHLSLVVANFFGNRYYNGTLTGYFWILAALVENLYSITKGEREDEEGKDDVKQLPVRVQRRLEADRRRKKRKVRYKP